MIEARVVLGGSGGATVGRERIRLLAAVAREGSISAGARSVGLTYKAAWDAIDAMNTVAGTRLVATQAGGTAGGGTNLTTAGTALIAGYLRLEAEMARAVHAIEPDFAIAGLSSLDPSAGFVRTSARNALSGTIAAMQPSEITVDVMVALRGGGDVRAFVTRVSVHEMSLTVGRDVMVLIKASLVTIRAETDLRPRQGLNRLEGTLRRFVEGATQAEVVLDLGQDRMITATVTAEAARDLGLEPGGAAAALFDPAHVILAIT